jgi:hypothetical protein
MKFHALLSYVMHTGVQCSQGKGFLGGRRDGIEDFPTSLNTAMKRELSHLQGGPPRVRLMCLSEQTYFSVARPDYAFT